MIYSASEYTFCNTSEFYIQNGLIEIAHGRKDKNLAADDGIHIFFLAPLLKFSDYFLVVYFKNFKINQFSLTGLYYEAADAQGWSKFLT